MGSPVDESQMVQQALDLLPSGSSTFKANNPILLMGIAAGQGMPLVEPSLLEDVGFATELRRESLYGPSPIFDRAKGTNAKLVKGTLIVTQPNGAEIRLDPKANISFRIPLARPAKGAPFPIYEEDAELVLKHMPGFAKYMLDRVDAAQRVTYVVIALKMFGTDMMVWRKKADTGAALEACAVSPPPEQGALMLSPAMRSRVSLTSEAGDMAAAFIALLKPQARWAS